MSAVRGLKGMRHVALRVKDVKRSKAFYQEVLGMSVVWDPDPQNVYLSSGPDNIALHEIPADAAIQVESQRLDHVGFLVESVERVQELEADFENRGITIVAPFKIHRDGSASFYLADPDGIVIQMLYEPTLSRQEIG